MKEGLKRVLGFVGRYVGSEASWRWDRSKMQGWAVLQAKEKSFCGSHFNTPSMRDGRRGKSNDKDGLIKLKLGEQQNDRMGCQKLGCKTAGGIVQYL